MFDVVGMQARKEYEYFIMENYYYIKYWIINEGMT